MHDFLIREFFLHLLSWADFFFVRGYFVKMSTSVTLKIMMEGKTLCRFIVVNHHYIYTIDQFHWPKGSIYLYHYGESCWRDEAPRNKTDKIRTIN